MPDRPSNNILIRLRGVSKRFGNLHVLREANLDINEGQCTVIIGESGVGKSVTLKLIIGLLKPDQGEIYYRSTRVDLLSERQCVTLRKEFGFLFQMGALFDSMTAGENVAFPLQEHTQLSSTEIDAIVHEKLRLVGLDGFESKKPGTLSGGQRKRVALARAIALGAKVILYDEPTTGLDPVRGDVINELIVKLQRELNVTSIVVTHDMASAYKVGDRIVMLDDGQFIADGTPEEIRACPDPLVRRFITGKASEKDLAALYH